MITSYLRDISVELLPELSSVEWDDLWERPFAEGSAFQWTIFAVLLATLRERGWLVEIPASLLVAHPKAYALWNSIPLQHSSQTGHVSGDVVPLHVRFVAALTPRATLSRDGVVLSVFREGCSVHQLTSTRHYSVRPDIVIAYGSLRSLEMNSGNTLVTVAYNLGYGERVSLSLAVRSSATLPIRSRMPLNPIMAKIHSIIECTTKKNASVLSTQLNAYRATFSDSTTQPNVVAVSFVPIPKSEEQIVVVLPNDSSRDAIHEAVRNCCARLAIVLDL